MSRLYDDILEVALEYMGIAAEDYIRRRIRIVSGGTKPEDIGPERLDRLAAGIDMTAKLYMSVGRAAKFREAILALKQKY